LSTLSRRRRALRNEHCDATQRGLFVARRAASLRDSALAIADAPELSNSQSGGVRDESVLVLSEARDDNRGPSVVAHQPHARHIED
jgi:hypothetical protein